MDIKDTAAAINNSIIMCKSAIASWNITKEDLENFTEYVNNLDNTLWFTDPTAYRDYLNQNMRNLVLARITAIKLIIDLPLIRK